MGALVLLAAVLAASPPEGRRTPRLDKGAAPAPPVEAVGGGEVILDVAVDAGGRPSQVRVLRDTPPFTAVLREAVLTWTFEAGAEGRVLVAGLFAPPALYAPTLGEPPRDVAAAPESLPFPSTTVTALYPPTAIGDGSVLVGVGVDAAGAVAAATVVRSAPGFDASALAAARRWRFRPARQGGAAVASTAYLVFGFRQPVLPPPRPR